MDKIYIGNRSFFLGTIPPSTLEVLTEKIKGLTIPEPDTEGKTDIGDVVLFILTAVLVVMRKRHLRRDKNSPRRKLIM